jgi:hypothetical protein
VSLVKAPFAVSDAASFFASLGVVEAAKRATAMVEQIGAAEPKGSGANHHRPLE